MFNSVKFENPPIVELIFGVQFSPLSQMTIGHFGWFWKELGEDWLDPSDGPAFPDQFERFEQPAQTRMMAQNFEWLSGSFSSMGRIAIGHRQRDRLLQVQASQFRFHWRKSQEVYPSYHILVQEFEKVLGQFSTFAQSTGLGKVILNQWDLTYVDSFPRVQYWEQPQDWAEILPGLFGVPLVADGLTLDSRSANWSYIIGSNQGRLHVAAGTQILAGESEESLLLRMTARGPTRRDETQSPRKEFDVGHEAIYNTFLRVSSDKAKSQWGHLS